MNHHLTSNHSGRRMRRRLGAAAVVAVALPGLALSASPAAASLADENPLPHGLRVQATDGRSTGQCEFKVERVNSSAGTVTGRLSNQAWANGLGNSLNNVWVGDRCNLRDQNNGLLTTFFREADGPRLGYGDTVVTVPLMSGYVLCTVVGTVTRSGAFTTSPEECTS